MRITITPPTKEKRKIKTIQTGEAFRWGNNWYVKVEINDDEIPSFGNFYDEHVLSDMPEASGYDKAIAVMHLGSQAFCYANGELEADEWANLVASLCVK
jgi:hypothetical protein